MKKLFLTFLVVALGAYGWYRHALSPADKGSAERVPVTVEQGMSTNAIASLLAEKGVIRSPLAFKLYLKLHGIDGSLQAGKFVLQPSVTALHIIEALQSGKAEEISVTIPEGYTVRNIDALLAELGLIEPGEVIACASTCDFSSYPFVPSSASGLAERGGKLEGYLYPDTYFVNPNDFVAKFFLERMLNAFRTNVVEGLAAEIAASGREINEVVIMASLVEKESRKDEERPFVADILWKRLDSDWGLGVDAAVRYIVNKPTEAITVSDLNVNSPYNLRKFNGLTPGPIANPGLESIEATLKPEPSKYWYYLHANDGTIHYAVTNEEHNLNRINYLGSGAR